MGGTPPPHDSLVSFLDRDTGKVAFLDTLTGELVDGASLNQYTSKKSGSPPALKSQVLFPFSSPALKSSSSLESITSVAFFDSSEANENGECASTYPNVGAKVSTKFAPDVCAPASPARSLKDHTQGSPTSVMFFGDSEAEQAPALPDLSKSVHSKLLDFVLPSVSTPVTTRDVSSTYEKDPDSRCFSYGQDLLSNSISTETFSNALACFFITPCFFPYWFDGFWSSQCPCALIILIILSGDPFYDVAPKVRLSKYLKYVIICLDLACTKAGPRAAISIASVAATIAVPSSEFLQSVDLRSSSGFGFSDGLFPSKTATLGTATDLRITPTSSLNSA